VYAYGKEKCLEPFNSSNPSSRQTYCILWPFFDGLEGQLVAVVGKFYDRRRARMCKIRPDRTFLLRFFHSNQLFLLLLYFHLESIENNGERWERRLLSERELLSEEECARNGGGCISSESLQRSVPYVNPDIVTHCTIRIQKTWVRKF